MRKKLIFIGMVMLALVLTTGTFAYTYTNTGTTTLNATIADAVMTTYQPSAVQPEWEDMLPESLYGQEFLLPDAPGDETGIPDQTPDTGQHWDKVADNNDATYVSSWQQNHYRRDLYNLSDYVDTAGEEEILAVTVYFRFADGSGETAHAKAAIKTNGTVFEGDEESTTGAAFTTKSYQWTDNPATSKAWTWDDINELQAGVSLQGNKKDNPTCCSQVFVVVDYECKITEGDVPTGNLYDITPHPDYTGDMQVRIYLTNTADLLKAYRYLNMKLYMENSLEAEKTPDYQVLSMENGVVSFNIEGGSAASYTVAVTGGSYRVFSDDYDEWGEGWSITPEFYCEVTQR